MKKQYLGIDIGGTAVKLGLVDEEGSVFAHAEASVAFDGYRTPIMDTVCREVEAFLAGQNIAATSLSGIGISATGQIDSRHGVVAGTCGSLPDWKGVELTHILQQKFSVPATAANDANCMCLGEVWGGAATGYTDVIGVTIGTGIGGGILTGGRLLEGARGLGGEMGHMPVHAVDGVHCTCGNIGCWERYASTSALVRAAQEQNPSMRSGRDVFDAAQKGDVAMQRVLDQWTDEIAAGLIGLVHIFNPQIVLIGGGVSSQQKLLIEPLAAKIRAGAMPAFAEGLEIRAAARQNDAGLAGAVYFFRQTVEGV